MAVSSSARIYVVGLDLPNGGRSATRTGARVVAVGIGGIIWIGGTFGMALPLLLPISFRRRLDLWVRSLWCLFGYIFPLHQCCLQLKQSQFSPTLGVQFGRAVRVG